MASAWGCPHEIDNTCSKVANRPCDPGMKGCVLAGRYFFFDSDAKNERLRTKRVREEAANTDAPAGPDDVSASTDNPKDPPP